MKVVHGGAAGIVGSCRYRCCSKNGKRGDGESGAFHVSPRIVTAPSRRTQLAGSRLQVEATGGNDGARQPKPIRIFILINAGKQRLHQCAGEPKDDAEQDEGRNSRQHRLHKKCHEVHERYVEAADRGGRRMVVAARFDVGRTVDLRPGTGIIVRARRQAGAAARSCAARSRASRARASFSRRNVLGRSSDDSSENRPKSRPAAAAGP